jgi:hypothetical protein
MGHTTVVIPLLSSSYAAIDTLETECLNREEAIFIRIDAFVIKLER